MFSKYKKDKPATPAKLDAPAAKQSEHDATKPAQTPSVMRKAAPATPAQVTPIDKERKRKERMGEIKLDPQRTRKLLLHKRELAKILAATTQKGQTCVCTQLYWKGHLVKARIALAEGKKAHDKRHTQKERDWNRQKQRIIRDNVKQ